MFLQCIIQLNHCNSSLIWHCRRWFWCQFVHSHQRFNSLNIQMLTDTLHKQIFPNQSLETPSIMAESSKTATNISSSDPLISSASSPSTCKTNAVLKNSEEDKLKKIQAHLKKFGLLRNTSLSIPDVHMELPNLYGSNIEEHFQHIATEQVKDYKNLAQTLVTATLPLPPVKWALQKGWTKYKKDGSCESVPFPDAEALIFDIECLVSEGNFPTMATAVSQNHWYSWTSEYVLENKLRWTTEPQLSDLIPLETKQNSVVAPNSQWKKRLIVGHNVGFDRSFVKEQYLIQGTKLRFLDTMSLHIAICGLTSFQRILHKSSSNESQRKEVREHAERMKMFNRVVSEEWKKVSGMNNLSDVYQLHCQGKPLDKEQRNIFISGTMADVRSNFQDLMSYCSKDVQATQAVFSKVWPQFLERFPNPVTLGGMFEMGTAYLPIDSRWSRYLEHANATYAECQRELQKLLISLADEACHLLEDEAYKEDIWLWDLDWTVSDFKIKKCNSSSQKELANKKNSINGVSSKAVQNGPHNAIAESKHVIGEETHNVIVEAAEDMDILTFMDDEESRQERRRIVESVYATTERVPKKPTFMAGYPAWYRELCPRLNDEDWSPGPCNISTQCRVTPKLMRLTWDGFPMHYDDTYGWGYLVPTQEKLTEVEKELEFQDPDPPKSNFPLRAFQDFMKSKKPDLFQVKEVLFDPDEYLRRDFDSQAMDFQETILHWDAAKEQKKDKKSKSHLGDGPYDIGLPGCLFYRIPHKDGGNMKVGNPLAKDYLHRVKDGTLQAETGDHANHALKLSKLCSYWKNNQERIGGQMALWLKKEELAKYISKQPDFEEYGQYGAIVPRIVVSGTITRRAVEPTWLTASNAYPDRIGSELKAMIHTPPGYHFVGADVDSQELWIAAILGDAYFMKMHGCTALGWMTLQGNKADKTDLHSKTAEIARVSRDQAKILNYGRIYGAGQAFAEQLLMQFNPSTSQQQARSTAKDMFRKTKGERNQDGTWTGGSESFMFNALEKIANSQMPTTPVLGCRISKALEPKFVLDDFLPSRVNWVVQSSAVDYLHLMLVSMRWLLDTYGIQGRFCISIHDEVRYLVMSPDRYRAALALHITNLLTRSFFAARLGMNDLPQSVAFFSAVDVDVCLRKEVTMDCKTPSNPQGLKCGYGIPQGEALDIFQVIQKTGGKLSQQ